MRKVFRIAKSILKLFISRMMFQYLFPEELAVDMCVYFGGGDLFVPQHFLDCEQIGATFQQMGRE
jgi:hypothetical protein